MLDEVECKLSMMFYPHWSKINSLAVILDLSVVLTPSASRSKDLSARNRASMLQGVLHPGQQAEADLWGCQAGLQVGRRRAAQHRNGERAAVDRKVHTSAAGWRRRLLDRSPSQPTATPGWDHKPRLPLTILLAGWKQGQVQVFNHQDFV